jgi:uncharacterized protein
MKSMVISVLQAYKRWISPMLPNACRYVPTCSEYAIEAVERHGVLRGSALAAWRIVRCNPFCGHGLDLVPGSTASYPPQADQAHCCSISK